MQNVLIAGFALYLAFAGIFYVVLVRTAGDPSSKVDVRPASGNEDMIFLQDTRMFQAKRRGNDVQEDHKHAA